MANRFAEELKTALSVGDIPHTGNGAHYQGKHPRSQSTIEWLPAFDAGLHQPARTDDDVGAGVEPRPDLVELGNRDLVIGVGVADNLTGGDSHREPDTSPFPAPLL